MGQLNKNTSGYSLVEVVLASTLFAIFMTMVGTVMINFYNAQKRERAKNMVLEETQYLMGRISNLVRENAIDYEEYFSNGCDQIQNSQEDDGCVGWEDLALLENYGNDVGVYDAHFYRMPGCKPGESEASCDYDDPQRFPSQIFDTGADDTISNDNADLSAIKATGAGVDPHQQWELYLIAPDGSEKIMLRRTGNGIDEDNDGEIDEDGKTWDAGSDDDGDGRMDEDGDERIEIYRMVLDDSDSDGLFDGYKAAEDFSDGFVPITPLQSIEIVDLRFFIAPLDDPRKAVGEHGKDVQMQPHVTILLTVRPSAKLNRSLVDGDYEVTLQSTVSSRVLHPVFFPE